MTMTTIKVPVELRDRLKEKAAREGRTAAAMLEELLRRSEKMDRLRAFGAAMKTADDDYWGEFREWEKLAEGECGDQDA